MITKKVRPKIVNREKHWGKHRKQGKHYVKHGETKRRSAETCVDCRLHGFFRPLVTSSQAASCIDETIREFWGISIVYPLTFFYVKRLEISVRSKIAEANFRQGKHTPTLISA